MKKTLIICFFAVFTVLALGATNVLAWDMIITSNTTLTSDLICSGDGILINADDVTLDCAGYTIRGPGTGSGTGIYSMKSRGTIKNGVIEDFKYEIYLNSGNDWTITDNIIGTSSSGKYARYGMYLKSGSGHTITDNTIDLSDSTYAYCRAIYLRYISDSTVEDNNIDGSTYIGITIAKSSSTGNTVQHNNIKNCPQSTASDSGANNTWDSNYYDDAIDWDCDGMTVHVISSTAADLNAYVVENGWKPGVLPTYVDDDGDGYGVNCQLGTDNNDNNPKVNTYMVEKELDDFEKKKLGWEYICRPWWDVSECDEVYVSLVECQDGREGQCMGIEIKGVDTTGFNWSQYIDVFYQKDEMDWSERHTITFWVYPVNEKSSVTRLCARFDNDPECRNDLPYPENLFVDDCRENQKCFSLASNTWNKVVWDLAYSIYAEGLYTPGDPRPTTKDNIKSLRFFIDRDPKYFENEQDVTFYIDDIHLLHDK